MSAARSIIVAQMFDDLSWNEMINTRIEIMCKFVLGVLALQNASRKELMRLCCAKYNEIYIKNASEVPRTTMYEFVKRLMEAHKIETYESPNGAGIGRNIVMYRLKPVREESHAPT